MGIRCLQTKYLTVPGTQHTLTKACGINEEHSTYIWKQLSLGDDRASREDLGGPGGRQQWPGHQLSRQRKTKWMVSRGKSNSTEKSGT